MTTTPNAGSATGIDLNFDKLQRLADSSIPTSLDTATFRKLIALARATPQHSVTEPASIGDDSQFSALVMNHAVAIAMNDDGKEAYGKLVAYIDSRAQPLASTAVTQPEQASDWTVGNLLTMSDSEYPGMGSMFTQIWQSDDLIARVYGDSADEVRTRSAIVARAALAIPASTAASEQADWHNAVLIECMRVESCYDAADPAKTVAALIDWHVQHERGVVETIKVQADNYLKLTCGTAASEQQAGALSPCADCGNEYLAIRTDIYKDKREFVYCDGCGLLAAKSAWNRIGRATTAPGYKLVPVKITPEMIESGLVAHYGKRRVAAAGGPGGIDMTVNDVNYSGTHAMRNFWRGALAAAAGTATTAADQRLTALDASNARLEDVRRQREEQCAQLGLNPATAADQQGKAYSAFPNGEHAPADELIAAAAAVVERWHSRDWKQPHTAEFIARLAAAVGTAKAQQGAAQAQAGNDVREAGDRMANVLTAFSDPSAAVLDPGTAEAVRRLVSEWRAAMAAPATTTTGSKT